MAPQGVLGGSLDMRGPSAPTQAELHYTSGSLTSVYTPDVVGPVHVIAVHGMNTTSPHTWQALRNKNDASERCVNWLIDRDMLPSAIPNSQIWTFHYNTSWLSDAPVERLSNLADKLLLTLLDVLFIANGDSQIKKPQKRLVFIASSYGGIVIAKAIERAKVPHSRYLEILFATVGVVFLGSPLRSGPKLETWAHWFTLFKGMIMEDDPSDELRRDLRNNTGVLSELLKDFAETSQLPWFRLQIRCFYELRKTKKPGFKDFVVNEDAACIDTHFRMGLDATHTVMNKFFGPHDKNYGLVKQQICELVANHERFIKDRTQLRSKPKYRLPFPKNLSLIPREPIFKALRSKLPLGAKDLSAALYGLGGVGKTQMALDFAYWMQNEGYLVFWVHAANTAAFAEDFGKIAIFAGIEAEAKGEELLKAVRAWMEAQERVLLILDNADTLKMFQTTNDGGTSTTVDLSFYIPRGISILWTSRDSDIVGSLVEQYQGIEVAAMTDEEALLLLRRSAQRDTKDEAATPDELELLKNLERLPLAITQAAAFMRHTSTLIREYLELFNSEKTRKKLLDWEVRDRSKYNNIPTSVMRTWIISMKEIKQENPLSMKILRTISFYERQGIPQELVDAAAGDLVDKFDIFRAVGKLISFSFLQRQLSATGEPASYELHRLVQFVTILSLNNEETRYHTEAALTALNDIIPVKEGDVYDIAKWRLCAKYLPHAERLRVSVGRPDWMQKLLGKLSYYYLEQCEYDKLVDVQDQVLCLVSRTKGTKDPTTVMAMGRLLQAYLFVRSYDKFNVLAGTAMNLYKEVMGEMHPNTFTMMALILRGYAGQGQLDKAEELGLAALNLCKKIRGGRNSTVLLFMSFLATTYYKQGNYSKAEELGVMVLDLRKEILGDRHPDTLNTAAILLYSYYQQGNYNNAEELGVMVLDLRKEILGERHPETLRSMVNLTGIYLQQDNYSKAEELGVIVLNLRKEILGDRHPETLDAMGNLTSIYYKQGNYSKAEELGVMVLDLRKEILGDRHPDTLTTAANLVNAYYQQGNYGKAEELGVMVLDLRKEILGDRQPETLKAMVNLTIIYHQQGNYCKAEELGVMVLDLQKRNTRR